MDWELFKALNVFQYITFRGLCSAITAFLISLLFGRWVIRQLIALKFGQPIRSAEEVHRLYELHGTKKGTPTMGGILILTATVVSVLFWARWENLLVWVAMFAMLFLGAVGFYDDWLKVTKRDSKGIRSWVKFSLQSLLACIVTIFFLTHGSLSEMAQRVYIPFFKEPVFVNLGILTFVFYLLVIVGTSNAVNLTDGLDGLAAGCSATVAATYAALAYLAGNIKAATYLQIPYVSLSGELTVVCMGLFGACLGFLWWNCHPARVFMGDTGSLAIGGLLGVVAIASKQEVLLVVVGGVFVAEALSVILQVASFKLTGKRIFRMSPLHHHFELSGWKENTVIVRFWIMSLFFALLGLATLKLR
ncbi:MAG: phospho-N-acetylmuramoyl-pentapeptide-transferase [Chthoniobacterales bacterium]|nr:phospho-N-acetylmuramoyl-pentapeptide-transferase [Chthoniobacterales bacterium]